jgi:hypothetical protein
MDTAHTINPIDEPKGIEKIELLPTESRDTCIMDGGGKGDLINVPGTRCGHTCRNDTCGAHPSIVKRDARWIEVVTFQLL